MRYGSGVATAALATALALPGCGGSENAVAPGGERAGATATEAREGWASAKELRWLRDYGAWQEQFEAFIARVAETTEANGLAAALTPLTGCAQMFENDVGSPPTDRLRRVGALVMRACADWQQAGSAAMSPSHEGDGERDDVKVRIRRALRTMAAANGLLPPGEAQPLERGEPSESQSRVVPSLSRIASRLAGQRAQVRCWSRQDWIRLVREERELSVSRVDRRSAGITSIAAARINLRPELCASLAALAAGKPRRPGRETDDAAFALLVLAHEAQHAAGVTDEVLADCRGLQTMARAGIMLGLPAGDARSLARAYWRLYPRQPRIYVSRECRNGGRLDIRRNDSTWP